MVRFGLRHREPVRFLHPPAHGEDNGQRDDGQRKDASEAERARREAVDDGGDTRPHPVPGGNSAMAAARSREAVSSAAMTSASALVALRSGRPKAKMTTNHQ